MYILLVQQDSIIILEKYIMDTHSTFNLVLLL